MRVICEALRGPPHPPPYTYMYSYTEVVFTFGYTGYIYMKMYNMTCRKLDGYDML